MELCLIVALLKLAALDARVKKSTKSGYKPGSSKNLRTYINRYLDFCLEFKLPPVPAEGIQLRRFVQYLADSPSISSFQTLNNYSWGVKTFHKLLGLEPPSTTEFLTALLLKGLKLALARPIAQAEPITPKILVQMSYRVDFRYKEQLTAWVALLYGFHMLLCKSNLVLDTQKEFDPEKQLARKNICLAHNAILVSIEWSKTLQYKEKILPVPLIPIANKIICPVFWTWKLVQTIQARPLDPLFCHHRKGKYMVLTYARLTFWFKKWLDECHINSRKFSLHSFRRGVHLFCTMQISWHK